MKRARSNKLDKNEKVYDWKELIYKDGASNENALLAWLDRVTRYYLICHIEKDIRGIVRLSKKTTYMGTSELIQQSGFAITMYNTSLKPRQLRPYIQMDPKHIESIREDLDIIEEACRTNKSREELTQLYIDLNKSN